MYKPFVKCFDVEQMSEKFARGIDEEVIKIINLTDDYQKVCNLRYRFSTLCNVL